MKVVDADHALVRRAGRAVAWQTAVAVALLVALMGAALLVVEAHQQSVQALALSRSAWQTADDVRDPPAGVWLLVGRPDGTVLRSPGLPAAYAGLDPRDLPDGSRRLDLGGREAQVYTGPREAGRITAVYDLSRGELEKQRLVEALLAASLVGVAGAVVLGQVIGRRAVRPLGTALALQRRFVADASHELRRPLTILRTRAQLLARRLNGRIEPAAAAELDQLVADSQVLGDVVSDMLLAAEVGGRVDGGEPVDLCGVADDVVASMRGLAAERGIALEACYDDAADEAEVTGAAVAIRRAVSSLVDNALSHTPRGGHVSVGVRPGDGEVVVVVADDGEGLDPAQAGLLVQRFARGNGGSSRRFGLGLALVDEVARAHGGALEIDGVPGEGATFSLRLPRDGR